MGVVRHTVDGDEFLPLPSNYPSHVFLELLFPFWPDEVLSALDCEHNLDINLGVGIGHATEVFKQEPRPQDSS